MNLRVTNTLPKAERLTRRVRGHATFRGPLSKGYALLLVLVLVLAASISHAAGPRILMVSPEQTSILQTGGLAHATTGLAVSLNAEGIPTDVLMPFYSKMNVQPPVPTGRRIDVALDWREGRSHKTSTFDVYRSVETAAPTIFLRHVTKSVETNYFENMAAAGKTNYAPEPTIGETFGAFAKAAADYILERDYDIVILNDWTTGLIATHLREARLQGKRVPKVIFAIHNIAYQGTFPVSLADFLGLSRDHFIVDGYEFWGQMSFIKAGLQHSDLIYTVSLQYANETATPRFGAGLDGLMREKIAKHRYTGILNGILETDWDPRVRKEGLPFTFSPEELSGKTQGKISLQKDFGLRADASVPVFVLTSRLAEQKGFEYLIDAVADFASRVDSQWIFVADGDPRYAERLKDLERRLPERVRYRNFSGALEKSLTRYGDFFVNGAWFEPSGLNQQFAHKNGTIPVLSRAGGLMDSVKDGETGLLFDIVPGKNGEPYDVNETRASAIRAFERATELFKKPTETNLMRVAGMKMNHSWSGRINGEFIPMFRYVLAGGAQSVRATGALPSDRVSPPQQLLKATQPITPGICRAAMGGN